MTGPTAGSPAPTGAGPGRPPGPTAAAMSDVIRGYADRADRWRIRADQLETLLTEVARARTRATAAHAEAYLAAEGTQQARAATADLAAAAAVEDLETLTGRAEAFRLILAAEARADAHSAAADAR